MMGGMGRVFDGGYAEYTNVPVAQVTEVHTDLDEAVLGAIPEMLQTAYGSLTVGLDAQPGETLLVRGGTSSIGLATAVLAKQPGVDIDGDGSWYALLESRYGRRVVDGVHTVEPVVVEGRDAALLGIGSGRAAWRFLRTSRDERGAVVERVDALVRADRYLVEVEIARPRRPTR